MALYPKTVHVPLPGVYHGIRVMNLPGAGNTPPIYGQVWPRT